jgi:predicted DsbA family dithiol-disulfide isomerase
MPTVEFFSDLHCPHAYLTRYRLRDVEGALPSNVRFVSRCLSIEVDSQRPVPKPILDVETPLIAHLDDGLPYEPWPEAKTSRFPVTFLPAFEAVKAAEAIDVERAGALDWRIREAFFAEHACVALRSTLADLAEDVGFDRDTFLDVFDEGHREAVLSETNEGWYEEGFSHSPAIRLPDGTTHVNPEGHWTEMDPDRNFRVTGFDPGREDARGHLQALIEQALEA